jgi:acyl carrier protein
MERASSETISVLLNGKGSPGRVRRGRSCPELLQHQLFDLMYIRPMDRIKKSVAPRIQSGNVRQLQPDPGAGRQIEEDPWHAINAVTAFRVRAALAHALLKDISQIGLDDDFDSKLGGNSMLRVGVIASLEAQFRVGITDAAVRRFRTARQLAGWLSLK